MCSICSSSSVQNQCGHCKCDICKSCSEYLEPHRLQYLANKPESLSHSVYCLSCYNSEVAEQLEKYEQHLAYVEQMPVFMKDQSKETRLIKRKAKMIEVGESDDEQDVLLKLAYQASFVDDGGKLYNGLIDVEIIPKKIKIGGYTTTVYTGKGRPAHIEARHIVRDRSIWQNPN